MPSGEEYARVIATVEGERAGGVMGEKSELNLDAVPIDDRGRIKHPGLKAVGVAVYVERQVDSQVYQRADIVVQGHHAVMYRLVTPQRPDTPWRVRYELNRTVYDNEFAGHAVRGTPFAVEVSDEDWAELANRTRAGESLVRRIEYVQKLREREA